MLALRWELSQLLAASGEAPRPPGRALRPPWSRRTCLQLLDLMLAPPDGGSRAGGQEGGAPAALRMPPAVVAHALEMVGAVVRAAAEGRPGAEGSSDPEEKLRWVLALARRVVEVQSSCYRGLSQPHAVVRGGAHQEATAAAARMHSLLVAPSPSDAADAGGGGGAGQKRRRGEGGGGAAAGGRRGKKAAGAAGGGGGGEVVAELMQLLAAPPDAPTAAPHVAAPVPGKRRIVPESVASDLPTTTAQALTSSGASGRKRLTLQPLPPAATQSVTVAGASSGGDAATTAGGGAAAEAAGDESDAEAPPAGGPAWGVGRVVITATANLDDEAREAMWTAYIADKDRMVEMLGVSAVLDRAE
jgi:hypothetical protein